MTDATADPELNTEHYLATAAEMLSVDGRADVADLIRTSQYRLERTGWDNWNGGITLWTIYLMVAPATYARLGSRRETMEAQIRERLAPIYSQFTEDQFSVTISPLVEPRPNWRTPKAEISRSVRQNIFDGLTLDRVRWWGRLDDVEFLQRLYDLKALPSTDSRYSDAAGDIWQHRVNNEDWPDDWIYGDRRLNLLDGPADIQSCGPTRMKA